MFRSLSLLTRKRRAAKERERILASFLEWKAVLAELPSPHLATDQKLLVIRLDDIGDYLLFRNRLKTYKISARWTNFSVTLLGNISWKDIFTACDRASVDNVIWVDKREYLRNSAYRLEIWRNLRVQGFHTVVAPSRTRPLLLDDLCMLASAPVINIGAVNTYVHPEWNRISDSLYQHLYQPSDTKVHEFHFNGQFAAWACGERQDLHRPTVAPNTVTPHSGSYILCFIGANTRSKRWPSSRWIEFIKRYLQQTSNDVIIAGASKAEVNAALTIQKRVGHRVTSIAGQVSLVDMLCYVAGAKAVITNDTMAAHLGPSCNRITVIIANGVNYARFTEYASAGIDGVATVYPKIFIAKRRRIGEFSCNYEDVVTADIESIQAHSVLDALAKLLDAAKASDSRTIL